MMRRYIRFGLLAGFCLSLLVVVRGSEPPSALTPLQRLQFENHNLKVQLTQCQIALVDRESKMASVTLTDERTKLEAEFRKALQPAEGSTFNWDTGTFDAPKT